MNKLSEIRLQQEISTLICDYLICQNCSFIDRDRDRYRRGEKCKVCGLANDAGRLAFHLNISTLVNLINEAYHSKSAIENLYRPESKNISILILFCTLREALINDFLLQNMRANQLPKSIIYKLLDDNKMTHQKFNDLFSVITGDKWDKAIANISEIKSIDFCDVSTLMKEASRMRNKFLHDGSAWAIPPDYGKTCMDALPSLMALFVALHNLYTHPLIYKRLEESQSPEGNASIERNDLA
ncbi:hypothetical protein RIF25_05180 [Thermosynechococcaceae cyanobacterium BACA0444]|uniref:Uncharacterized protein n=1 Tax=Pseudocalidococcus azoricus BACA0444 TaxID=2918990 RepID=A0AAE4FQ74_9CYAN|nr:hypothetical protein [Pseudocalidococcus azoricus]MDS3860193.1 hypothetical protein [Pseudocalidococcus azoricus BACA0444]